MEENRPNEIDLSGWEAKRSHEQESVEENASKRKKNFRERKALIWDLMGGSLLEERWFRNNWKLFVLVGVMSLVNIANNYYSIGQLRDISKLEESIRDYVNRGLFISSEITEREQKDEVVRSVEHLGLGLESSHTAPYILYRDATEDK